jgi:poly-gamma-glutamate synthesis protein (capsule biosynthesis protein)
MIAAGADVIFGHHPHRLQPLEVVMGRPVAWSLGNFVWPSLSPAGSRTAVARVVFSPDGEVVACLVPAYIESPGHPVLTGDAECGPE